MSQANIPNITPTISLSLAQSVTLLFDTIALEELALAHLINAEAEKTQIVLGTRTGAVSLSPPVLTVTDLLNLNKSVRTTLEDAIKKEMLLEFKFENVLSVAEGGGICPLTPGRTRGFWHSNNGHAILDPNNTGFIQPGPVTIGEIGPDFRSFVVATISDSDQILLGNYCMLAGSNCGSLSDSLQPGTLETLMAQTLALTYNIIYITCYSGQTISELGCTNQLTGSLIALGLTPDSTVNDVLNLANSLIAHSLSTSPAPQTTQAQAGPMNSLIGCLNSEGA